MRRSEILFDSLPMMRLGARDSTDEVIIVPDFSISAYMLEEYISLGVVGIALPNSAPESKILSDLPPLLQKRIRLIDDSIERESVSRLLYPVRAELGVKELGKGAEFRFPKEMFPIVQSEIEDTHRILLQFAVGFNHGLKVGISLTNARAQLRSLRDRLMDNNGRTVLSQIKGLFSVYEDVTFEAPRPPKAGPPELISLFDRLLNDPNYLQLSEAVANLGLPQKRRAALSKVREWGRKLVANSVVAKGWSYAGKVLAGWTGAPIPEMDTLLTFLSGKDFPILVDLREARKQAVSTWKRTMNTIPPISKSGDTYEGVSWIIAGAPLDSWDGEYCYSYPLGTGKDLKLAFEKFEQQRRRKGLKPLIMDRDR